MTLADHGRWLVQAHWRQQACRRVAAARMLFRGSSLHYHHARLHLMHKQCSSCISNAVF